MTTSPPSTARPAAEELNPVQAWRRQAALALGANDALAQQFGRTGILTLEGKPVTVQPLGEQPTDAWIASTRAARPLGVDEGRWCDALMLATSQTLLCAQAGFGLAEDGDAVLILRTTPGLDDPALLGVELAGLLTLKTALVEGLKTRVPQEAQKQMRERASEPSKVPGDATPPSPDTQAFEAPEPVQVMVHAAMLHLGRTPNQALAVARTGGLEMEGRPIGLACDLDGENLVVSVDLGAGVIDTAAQRRSAARANTELLAFLGVAVVRDRGQSRLMARWHLPGQSAENFAGWLQDIARLAAAIVQRHTAAANH